jgi:hypothetical protein
MMTAPKKPRKQRKSEEPLPIQDLNLSKETVADLTEGEAEHVKGGMLAGDEKADGGWRALSRSTACG